MYFVYTDSLHNCIHKRTPENSQIVCRPSLDHEELGYKYGPVDIQVKVVVHETLEKYVTKLHHSLRYGDSDDRNKEIAACDSLGHAPEKLEIPEIPQSGVDQPPVTCDRLATLFYLAAPDLFRFSIHHKVLGPMEGIVLYLPCTGGEEKKDKVQLHMSSRALVFWKGRLIPYACLSKLLPFMHWGPEKRGEKLGAAEKEMQARTVLLLFLDGASGVDVTKFKIHSDLETHLSRYPQPGVEGTQAAIPESGGDFKFASHWNDQDKKWNQATADLPNPELPEGFTGRSDRSGSVSLRSKFKEWVKQCNAAYDKMVKLSMRIATRRLDEDEIEELYLEPEADADQWFRLIREAAKPQADLPAGLLDVAFRQPSELTFFKSMKLGGNVEYQAAAGGTLFKLVLTKDTYMTSLRKLREGSNFVDLPGMQYFKPTFSGSSSNRLYNVVVKVVAYFVATDTCYAKQGQAPNSYRGPACSVIVRRYPFDLFGGIYAVDSGALFPLEKAERKREMDKISKDVPTTLSVNFQHPHGDEIAHGKAADDPLRVYMDDPMESVCAKPMTDGKQVVTDWTRDMDWLTTDRMKYYEKLTIVQTLERQKTGDGGEITWEPVEEFTERNAKGDTKSGFVFNASRRLRLPEPGQYRLSYELLPPSKANAADARIGSTHGDPAFPSPNLKQCLYLVVQPSLPVSFKFERVQSEQEQDMPMRLMSSEKTRVIFTGRDEREVALSEDVRAQYHMLVTLALLAQQDNVRINDNDFKVYGGIVIPGKKKGKNKFTGLGFDVNVRIQPLIPGLDEKAEAMIAESNKSLKELASEMYEECTAEGENPMMGEPERPMSEFWAGSRSKSKEVELVCDFHGCRLMYTLERDRVFVIMDGGACYFDVQDFQSKGKKVTRHEWESNDPLPEAGETFSFLGGEGIMSKTLKVKVASSGRPCMKLSGPLSEKLSEEEHNLEASVENGAVLPKLTVSFADQYGAFIPGAPGDMVRMRCGQIIFPPQPLGPDGKVSFSALTLNVPAATLKACMSTTGQGDAMADEHVTKLVQPIQIDVYNVSATNGGAAGPSSAGGSAQPENEASTAVGNEEPAQGCDGCLAGMKPWKGFLTVTPSSNPTQLTLLRDGVDLAVDATAALANVVPISDVADRQLSGLSLRASNEVGHTMGGSSGPHGFTPFASGTRLVIDGEELTGPALESFLQTGALPEDHPALRMPRIVADGAKNVTIQLQLSKSGATRSRAGTIEHTIEIRLKLKPLPGPPHRWHLMTDAFASSASQASGGVRRQHSSRGGRGADRDYAPIVAVGDALDDLRIVAQDEMGNQCAPGELGPLTPLLKVEGDANQGNWPHLLLPDDDGEGEQEVELELEKPEESRPAARRTRTATASSPAGASATVSGVGDRAGSAVAADSEGGGGRATNADTRAFRVQSGTRVSGCAGAWTFRVFDPDGKLEAMTVQFTLLPGAPKLLRLRPSSLRALRQCGQGTRLHVRDLRFQVQDAAENDISLDSFELLPVVVERPEGADKQVPLANVSVIGKARFDGSAGQAEQPGDYVVEAMQIRFDRMAERPVAERPRVQQQLLRFKAKVKPAGGGGAVEVITPLVTIEASVEESTFVTDAELEISEEDRANFSGTVEAGSHFPEVAVRFILEDGRTAAYHELFVGEEAEWKADQQMHEADSRQEEAVGNSDATGDGVATRGQKRKADGSAVVGSPAAGNFGSGLGGGLIGALSAHVNGNPQDNAPTQLAPTSAAQPARGREGANHLTTRAPAPACSVKCTLQRTSERGAKSNVNLEHCGDGRFKLGGADCDFLSIAGDYELSIAYEEPRVDLRAALLPVGDLPDETKLQGTKLRFRVVSGPPKTINLPKRAIATCNNTRNLTAVAAVPIALKDIYGNSASAPPGLKVHFCFKAVPIKELGSPATSTAGPPTDPRLAGLQQSTPAAAAAAKAANELAAAAAAAASAAAAENAGLQEVDTRLGQPLLAPTISLPLAAEFDAKGVAQLEAATVAQDCEGDDCYIIFTLQLIGWSVDAMGVPPTTPPITVKFQNTKRLDAERKRKAEEQALLDQRYRELLEEYDEHERKRADLVEAMPRKIREGENILKQTKAAVQKAKELMHGQSIELMHEIERLQPQDFTSHLETLNRELEGCMKNTFQGSSGLSRRDEEDLWHERVQNAAFGTFGTIFEIVVPTEFKMHFHVDKIKQLAAVLSDILGNDTMKMAITTTRQAQDILYDTASFPRLFALESNFDKSLSWPDTGFTKRYREPRRIWAAHEFLQPIRDEYEQQLRNKILSRYANFLLADDRNIANAYKEYMSSQRRDCPTIYGLDGYMIASQGHVGGKSRNKETRIEFLRSTRKPYLGWTQSRLKHGVNQYMSLIQRKSKEYNEIRAQLQELEEQSQREEQEKSRLNQTALRDCSKTLTAFHTNAIGSAVSSGSGMTTRRSSEQAQLMNHTYAARRTRGGQF